MSSQTMDMLKEAYKLVIDMHRQLMDLHGIHENFLSNLSGAEQCLSEAINSRCSTHPDAPHSFMRDASHSAGRYVCECESWEPPKIDRLREWVGLTDDDEIPWDGVDAKSFARAIEAKLKEKNGG